MSEELKFCPFCGSENVDFVYYAECNSCGIRTKRYNNKEQAIKAWNQRSYKGEAFSEAFMTAFVAGRESERGYIQEQLSEIDAVCERGYRDDFPIEAVEEIVERMRKVAS